MKNIDNKQIPKARLVVEGFEEQASDILKDSPTCSKKGLRFVLALITHNEWKINPIDIKTAFLQSEETDLELFILPPKGKYVECLVLKKMSIWLSPCISKMV